MREIKFRGVILNTENDFVYGFYKNQKQDDIHCITNTDFEDEMEIFIKPGTVGQYTGLKDKNGVEIYEGDKVRDQRFNMYGKFIGNDYEVKFGNWSNDQDCECQYGGYGWYGSIVGEKDKYSDDTDIPLQSSNFEVIGNIHEGVKQ